MLRLSHTRHTSHHARTPGRRLPSHAAGGGVWARRDALRALAERTRRRDSPAGRARRADERPSVARRIGTAAQTPHEGEERQQQHRADAEQPADGERPAGVVAVCGTQLGDHLQDEERGQHKRQQPAPHRRGEARPAAIGGRQLGHQPRAAVAPADEHTLADADADCEEHGHKVVGQLEPIDARAGRVQQPREQAERVQRDGDPSGRRRDPRHARERATPAGRRRVDAQRDLLHGHRERRGERDRRGDAEVEEHEEEEDAPQRRQRQQRDGRREDLERERRP
eukprot:4404664-Prymnesium_polylepis.2